MELYQLKTFLAVARLQNLTRAADFLSQSQSSLSSQIKALEEETGVSLFKRTGKGMELTDAGRVLLTHAQEVLDAADSMAAKARSLAKPVEETITIGLNADPTFLRVSRINQELSLLNPPLNVIFLTSQTVRTSQMLRQGKIDIGFFYGQPTEEDLGGMELAKVPICVVIPVKFLKEGGVQGWAEVAAMPWIWVEADCPFYDLMGARFRERGLNPNRKVTTLDEQVVKELAYAGQGVAMVREDEARPLVGDGRVRVWEEGWLTLPLSAAWLKKNEKQKRLGEVAEALSRVWKS